MTAESGGGGLSGARGLAEAYGGSVLSAAGVLFPHQIGERTVGPANEDGHLANTYPLTPLRWRVAHTLADAIRDECWAHFTGESTVPQGLKPYEPRLLPDAGVSSVPVEALRADEGERSVPVVFWSHRRRLLVAQIPGRHITDVPEGSNFMWAQRFAGAGRFGAGRLLARRVLLAQPVRSVEVIPARAVPPTFPAY